MMTTLADDAVRGPELSEIWLPLLVFATLGGTWYHVLRLRERAIAHARRLCERHGLQLLDDSVGLHRLRAQWRHGALHVMREYRFEISLGGNDRQTASITLLGDRVVRTRMPSRGPTTVAPSVATAPFLQPSLPRQEPTSGNVVPFERGRRTLH